MPNINKKSTTEKCSTFFVELQSINTVLKDT